jgi:hypothetical protein
MPAGKEKNHSTPGKRKNTHDPVTTAAAATITAQSRTTKKPK